MRSERFTLLKQSMKYAVKAAATIALLSIISRNAPTAPIWALVIMIVAYATFSTFGALHFVVIRRLHRQYKLNKNGEISKRNNRWVITATIVFIAGIVSGFLFVLNSPKWTWLEWVFTLAGTLALVLLYRIFQQWTEREYAPRFARATAIQIAFWTIAISLCFIYAFVASPPADPTSIKTAFDSAPKPFSESPSCLMQEIDRLSAFSDTVISYGLAKASKASIFFERFWHFVSYAAIIIGLMSLFSFCLLTKQEICDEFRPLQLNDYAENPRTLRKNYFIPFLIVSIVLSGAFVWLDGETEKAQKSETGTVIQEFINDRESDFIFLLDGSYEQYKKLDAIFPTYNEKRERIISEAKTELEPLVTEYFKACRGNINTYLTWREELNGGGLKWLFAGGVSKTDLTRELTAGVSDYDLQETYKKYRNELISLGESCIAELEKDDLQATKALIGTIESQINFNESLDRWAIIDNPAYSALVSDATTNNLSREDRELKVEELIEDAQQASLTKINFSV